MAEKDPVHVDRNDFFFAEVLFDAQSEHCLDEFSSEGASLEAIGCSSYLHGDGACPFPDLALFQVAKNSSCHSLEVHPVMGIETTVFSGDECVVEVFRELIEAEDLRFLTMQKRECLRREF